MTRFLSQKSMLKFLIKKLDVFIDI